MSMFEIATLLMMVRAEIRSLEQEAASLPPSDAAPVLAQLRRLSTRSRRLMRNTTVRLRSH
jgi:hypothetical protein